MTLIMNYLFIFNSTLNFIFNFYCILSGDYFFIIEKYYKWFLKSVFKCLFVYQSVYLLIRYIIKKLPFTKLRITKNSLYCLQQSISPEVSQSYLNQSLNLLYCFTVRKRKSCLLFELYRLSYSMLTLNYNCFFSIFQHFKL